MKVIGLVLLLQTISFASTQQVPETAGDIEVMRLFAAHIDAVKTDAVYIDTYRTMLVSKLDDAELPVVPDIEKVRYRWMLDVVEGAIQSNT